jgi:hypothetical protein
MAGHITREARQRHTNFRAPQKDGLSMGFCKQPVKSGSVRFATKSKKEMDLILKIAERAFKMTVFSGIEKVCLMMDISACHCNGNPLDLEKLLIADDFNFCHDVAGIHRHISRTTGMLFDGFSPRCSLPVKARKRRAE